MFTPKTEIYDALKKLGYTVIQGSQATFTKTPAITFSVANNSVNLNLDREITHQNLTVVVDIWADDSPTASRILTEVEAAMRAIGYQMTYSADIPAPVGALNHINCRLEAIV